MALGLSEIRIAVPFLASTQSSCGSSLSQASCLATRWNRGRCLEHVDCRNQVFGCKLGQAGVAHAKMKLKSFDSPADCYSLLKGEDSFFTLRERMGRGHDSLVCNAQSTAAATETEKEGWEQRQNEAGNGGPSSWHWTLNWNEITPSIVVGSCPRSPDDVDRIVEGSGISAILNVQSDVCFDALKIPFESIKRRASERGVYLERVPIRDFDHGDQVLMLPEAVRILNLLVARGLKVYVHCTAGINRASLTVVGYLTFIQGMNLDDAVNLVKSARSIAHPYIDCWVEARRRILDGRSEELTAVSRQIYESRCSKGLGGNSKSDWEAAQKQVVANTFSRWLKVDLGVIETELELLDRQYAAALRKVKTEFERDMADTKAERNHISFDYTQYVAAAAAVAPTTPPRGSSEEEDEENAATAALECDIVTRQCITSPNEVDRMFEKPLRWYLSRSH